MMEWWLPAALHMPSAVNVMLALPLAGVLTGGVLAAVWTLRTSGRFRLALLLGLLTVMLALLALIWLGRREQPVKQYEAEPTRLENLLVQSRPGSGALAAEGAQRWIG